MTCSYYFRDEENEAKIEKAFPFVKVEKMVRRFPDKMTIYVSGRIPEVVVKDSEVLNKWYVLDIEKKCWIDEIFSVAELDKSLISKPVPTGAIAGKITDKIIP